MKQATKPTETFTCDTDPRFGKTGRTWHGTEGTVIFLDGFGRWNRETADGRERTFSTAREAFSGVFEPAETKATGYAYPSYAAWCNATGRTVS